jgi:cysteine desulfurase family protein (TIGR01976 family)
MIDVQAARAHFPALAGEWALFDNAGGSVPARAVIERIDRYLRTIPVQHGASYALSRDAERAVEAGRRAAACLVGADPDEVVLGASSTALVRLLARALLPRFEPGDEVVVTNLDHESNIGPWRALEANGVRVREWGFRPDTLTLELADLEPLLSERTRLVCFTHCSNVVGTVHDVAAIAARARAVGAWTCVDGVAFAPHRRVDVRALGVDFYFASLYKTFGPHQALLFGRRELLTRAASQGHFFQDPTDIPHTLEPGNVNYELTASLPGITEYLTTLDGGPPDPEPDGARLEGVFERIAAHERALAEPLLAFLAAHPRVTLHGAETADSSARVPTISFTVDGMRSSELPPRLDERKLAVRFGHFYAYRAVRAMGLLERDGVVRVSLMHYNTSSEVARLVDALDELL